MFVSILIPCFNNERWVAEAIESALAQTHADREVIVLDDGSTDGSLDLIRAFGDRIRWEAGPNRGGNAARNRLLELSRGEWVQYLDADDYLLPGKISRQVEFVETHPSTDVVFSPITLEHWSEGERRREVLRIQKPHDPWILLARWFLPQTGACLWRRQAIIDVGGWRIDQPCCQEHELYLRLLQAGKVFNYCESEGAVYRQWSEHTVSRSNIREVHRQRLQIEEALEEFLRRSGESSGARIHAVNLARFEIARKEWSFDEEAACAIIKQICNSDPRFVPVDTPAAPTRYRIAFRLLGFRRAERLAEWLRVPTSRPFR